MAADATQSFLFMLAIFAPLLACLLGFESGMGLTENRPMAPRPAWAKSRLEDLTAQVDAYYRDWFGFRARLIHLENTVLHKWLRVSSTDAIIGKEGWIFYAREGVFENFLGAAPFSQAELESWRDYLERRQRLVGTVGGKYLFVVAPDKSSIYPEQLPDWLSKNESRQKRLDQLVEYLKASGSNVALLDLRTPLRAGKSEGFVYFSEDTHWNGRGYYDAYRAILRALSEWIPDLTPQQLGSDLKVVSKPWGGGDWIMLFGVVYEGPNYSSDFIVAARPPTFRRVPVVLPSVFPEIVAPWYRPLKTVNEQRRYRLLLFHDSFMRTGFEDRDYIPFAENFGETLAVGGRPTETQLSALVNQEHPDVVIEEIVERHLQGYAPLQR